jgi:hypothetical protein
MTTEIKKIVEETGKTETAAVTTKKEEVDINKSNTSDKSETVEELKNRMANMEFDRDFDATANEYPFARDFKEEIKAKTAKGYSVRDATVAVLNDKGKLQTAEQLREATRKGKDLGGSSATVDVTAKGEKSLSELEKDFKEAEARGEIRLT